MKQKFKSIKKSTLVIVALVALNVLTFTLLSSNIKHNYATTENITVAVDGNNYFKAGVDVLDWSYKLLSYFRR